ncbi:MAG: xylulokinase [Gammaproteobacteria bacterium]
MYLGIDLGTSSIKLILLDEQQNILAQHSEPLSISHPKPLWSEQNPDEWWQATCRGVQQLKKHYNTAFSALKAIGLAGQQHGATLLNASDDILRPAMLWNDGRAFAECKTLAAKIASHAKITGNRIMPGFTAPKIVWVAKHEPDIFKQLAKVLLPKDFLRLKITGEYATDMSDAAGTMWLDTYARDWSDDMLNACGLTRKHMPTLFEGSDITGTVTADIASSWGISPQTMVVGGAGDNPAGAISVNVIQSGSAFLSLGTSGVFFVASDTYQANPKDGLHTFCHCIPDYWHHMSVHLSSASCVSWLAATLNESDANRLMAEVVLDIDSKSSVIFLPYLSGERTPHNNPHAQAVFFGMTHATTRADLTRAVLEGVAFAFADGQDAITQAGIKINDVSVVGGGSQNVVWGDILASVLQRPLIYRSNRDIGAALGAARLAWLGINRCDPQSAFVSPPIEKIIEPNTEKIDFYAEKRQKFQKLYHCVEDLFV